MNNPYDIVQTLLITEKGTELADDFDQYLFKVDRKANKRQIRQAVEALFDVKVAWVNTMNRSGKRKRLRRGGYGRSANWKKAVVKLEEGSIELI